MTDEVLLSAIRRAVRRAVDHAFTAGQAGGKDSYKAMQGARTYAEILIVNVVNTRIEQACEDAFAEARRVLRPDTLPVQESLS